MNSMKCYFRIATTVVLEYYCLWVKDSPTFSLKANLNPFPSLASSIIWTRKDFGRFGFAGNWKVWTKFLESGLLFACFILLYCRGYAYLGFVLFWTTSNSKPINKTKMDYYKKNIKDGLSANKNHNLIFFKQSVEQQMP